MPALQPLSFETKAVYDRLLICKIGETVTYQELETLIGMNPQTEGYHFVASARKKALNEKGIVFDAVENQGIKRITDAEIIGTTGKVIDHVRRVSRKGFRRITAVADFSGLKNDEKIRHNALASFFGVLHHMSSHKTVKKIEGKVQSQTAEALPLNKTLEMFQPKAVAAPKPQAPAPIPTEVPTAILEAVAASESTAVN